MTAPATQTSSEAINSLALLGKVSVVLILTILVILACAWMFKRFGQVAASQQHIPMRVLSVLSVGPKEKVVVVQVDDQRLILGVAPGSVTSLSELSPADPDDIKAPRPAQPSPFARMLKSRQQGKSSS
ncbi:flagellar biosynthetic protein FliO [Aliidiomarina indica]|uniref:flagellar biosynthetic protein FliO n=1 Tax=Aliidiomarina indica TaxID=2749147 RepID=UPI00188F609C|nr:flagellar biosynthetic protein FliO [Aliidiomarina indica]